MLKAVTFNWRPKVFAMTGNSGRNKSSKHFISPCNHSTLLYALLPLELNLASEVVSTAVLVFAAGIGQRVKNSWNEETEEDGACLPQSATYDTS